MNDYEIVQAAGTGIAMGNSVQKLKDAADYVTDDIVLHAASANFNVGDCATIQVNDVEYSMNQCGLNIVVYDKKLGRVVDSVSVNTNVGLRVAERS